MNELKIYQLLSSGNEKQENQGLKQLSENKNYFLRKHRFPVYFVQEEKDDVFYWGLFKLLENIQKDKFQYKESGNLEAYLYTLILRRIYSKGRAKKLESLSSISETKYTSTTTVFDQEVLEKIQELFEQKLGENCRKILLMRHRDGLKLNEIAESLGIAIGTVKNNSSMCLKKLKKLIDQEPKLGHYIKGLLNN